MNKIIFSLALYILFCTPANAIGIIFSNAVHPLTATCAIKRNNCCMKCGQSTAINILGLFEFGDSGICAAAKDACIQQIHYVDVTKRNILFIFGQKTTTVYGE